MIYHSVRSCSDITLSVQFLDKVYSVLTVKLWVYSKFSLAFNIRILSHSFDYKRQKHRMVKIILDGKVSKNFRLCVLRQKRIKTNKRIIVRNTFLQKNLLQGKRVAELPKSINLNLVNSILA